MIPKYLAEWSRDALLKPGQRPNLKRLPPALDLPDDIKKKQGREVLLTLSHELADLQRKLFAEKKRKVLIVMQGMDTSGKDGTIRHVFRLVNPSGVHVAAFNRPTSLELSYDYMWRVHKQVPRRGEIVIFDRSHYEDIVTVRVNDLMPPAVWKKRFKHINDFEEMLADEGVTIIKIFLHIDRETQRERLQSRLDQPNKHWKFEDSDLVARARWNEYMKAYEDVLERCNARHAPWYIIPSNKKWVRNLMVAGILVKQLNSLKMRYPDADFDPEQITINP